MDRTRAGRIAFWVATAVIFVLAAMLRGRTMGQPLESGYHELGIRQAVAARNFLAHGVVETRGAMVENGGPSSPDELQAYARHPPLLPILLAGVFRVFGDTLTVYRATHIAISLACIAMLMVILRRTHGAVAALGAGLVAAVCPMSAFYATGGDVLGEGLNLLILAGVACRVGDEGRPGRGRFAAELAFYFLATLYDWPGVFAFGIPLADAVISGRFRAELGRGLVALGAGAAAFALVYWWAAVVVPARFPECRLEGAASNWTAARLVQVHREYPDVMWASLAAFFDTEKRLWTVPILSAAAVGLAAALAAAVRGRFAASGGRVLVLLLVPGLAFAVTLTAMFVLHVYAPIVLVPAIAAAAGAAVSLVARLRAAGYVMIAAWAAWTCLEGATKTDLAFETASPVGLYEAAVEAAAHSEPRDLVVTYVPTPWALGWYARRNVVADATDPRGNLGVDAYLARHPDAKMLYVLPPAPRFPEFHPKADRKAAEEKYAAVERALESRSQPIRAGEWRVYRIP